VRASILIAKYDDMGTDTVDDDVALDGASFEVWLDDGDEVFDTGSDTLAYGPATTKDGLLDTDPLPAGWYWIVESVVPDGYVGSAPILVELNLDAEVTCVWDASGLVGCFENEVDVVGLSWTIVEVENSPVESTPAPTSTPTPTPSGGVAGATGTPAITLPPTDMPPSQAGPAGDGWRLILLALAGLVATTLLLTPSSRLVRVSDRRD
jgi:hypothetical protein